MSATRESIIKDSKRVFGKLDVSGKNVETFFENLLKFTSTETTAPTVATYLPADGATGVSLYLTLTLTFSEEMKKGTGNILIKQGADDATFDTIPVATNVTVDGTKVIIHPTKELAANTAYYVTIPNTALTDLLGNAYAGIAVATTWNFTTANVAVPTVIGLSPADGATGVGVRAIPVMTFNEKVKLGATVSGAIHLSSDNSVVVTLPKSAFKVYQNQVHLEHNHTFLKNTGYYIKIAANSILAVSDDAAYAGITDATTWNFTTRA